MIRIMGIAVAGLLCFTGTVAAQSPQPPGQRPAFSFEELGSRMSPGDTVFVVDVSGQESRGRVASLSGMSLTVIVDEARRQFDAAEVKRVDRRRRDSVRNGVLIGAAAGALIGFALGRSMDSPDCVPSRSECGQGAVIGTVGGTFWGALAGWITDARIRKRETIYLSPGLQQRSSVSVDARAR
jgi:hypothetical protein